MRKIEHTHQNKEGIKQQESYNAIMEEHNTRLILKNSFLNNEIHEIKNYLKNNIKNNKLSKNKLIDHLLFLSTMRGNDKILSLFLDINYLDNHTCYNHLYVSTINNHHNIVKLLLNYNKTDFFSHSKYIFSNAVLNADVLLVAILLKDKRTNITEDNNLAIDNASRYKKYDILSLLWECTKIKKTLKKDNPTLYQQLIKKDVNSKIQNF